MEKSIQEIQNDIVEEFALFDENEEKYSYIIELGKKLSPFPEADKTSSNIIKGCQSQVWLTSALDNDKVIYKGDSDAIIVKGLVSLLVRALSNHTPDEILNTELYFIDKIGMHQLLSPTRSNGLASMLKQMKLHALAYKSKLAADKH